jgi:hypothetical protein
LYQDARNADLRVLFCFLWVNFVIGLYELPAFYSIPLLIVLVFPIPALKNILLNNSLEEIPGQIYKLWFNILISIPLLIPLTIMVIFIVRI